MILYAFIRSQVAIESRSLKLMVFLKRVEEPYFSTKVPTP